jgi:hypothetical protein
MELSTTDADGAKAFYGELLGWSFFDTPAGPDMTYTFLRLGDDDVGALYQQPPAQREAGVPPHWLLYVAVDDVNAAAARAGELGGTVEGPYDVGDAGRCAMVNDPQGARFALWWAGEHCGAARLREPGAWAWSELLTSDPAAAGEFYSGLFGWGRQASPSAPAGAYTEWKDGEESIGGMMAIPDDWEGVPPHWMLYLQVEDPDAVHARAVELGARVEVPPMDIPDVGRFTLLADPQGARFTALRLDAAP